MGYIEFAFKLWLLLAAMKTLLIYAQLSAVTRAGSQSMECEATFSKVFGFILITPVIVFITSPFKIFSQRFNFFSIQSEKEWFELFSDLKRTMFTEEHESKKKIIKNQNDTYSAKQLDPEILESCYHYLRRKRKLRTVHNICDYLRKNAFSFMDYDIFEALKEDPRFIVKVFEGNWYLSGVCVKKSKPLNKRKSN